MGQRGWSRWAPLAMVLIPLVINLLRMLALGWQPQGDTAIIMLRSWDVLHGHPPIVGQNSTAGVTDATFAGQHPGPLHYYLLAPFVALWGSNPVGGLVGSFFLHGALMLLTVDVARRHLGSLATLGIAGLLTLTQLIVGVRLLEPWNPWPAMLGLFASVVLAWAILDGSRRLLPVYAAVASLAAQSHLGMLPVIGLLTVGLGLALAMQWWRNRSGRIPAARSPRERNPLRQKPKGRGAAYVIAVAAAGLCWLPVLIEAAVHSPSNLSRIFAFATSDAPRRAGIWHAADVLTRWIGPGPLDISALTRDPAAFFFGLDLAHPSTTQRLAALTRPGMLLLLVAIGVLVSAMRGAPWARNRSWAPLALASLTALGCVVSLSDINLDPRTGTTRLVYGILYLPTLALLWPLIVRAIDRQWLAQRLTRFARRITPWAPAIVLIAALLTAWVRPMWMEAPETMRAQREIAAAAVTAAQSGAPGDRPVVIEATDPSAVSQIETMEFALVTNGYAVHAPATYTTNRHDSFRSVRSAPADASVITVRDVIDGHPEPPLPPGEKVVARVRHSDFFYQDGVWRVSVRTR